MTFVRCRSSPIRIAAITVTCLLAVRTVSTSTYIVNECALHHVRNLWTIEREILWGKIFVVCKKFKVGNILLYIFP